MTTPRQVDVAFAGMLAVTGLVEVPADPGHFDQPGAAVSLALIGAAAMLLRSTRPLACLAIFVTLVAVPEWFPGSPELVTAALVLGSLIALTSVARRSATRVAVAALVATAGMYVSLAFVNRPWDFSISLLGTGTAFGVGRLLRREAHRNADLAALAADLAAEREARAREAVGAERTRIARELHDSVAHTVSVMTIQAGAVRRRLEADAARTRERDILLEVERLGREAVDELHRAVGVLRQPSDADESASLAPQPRLANLDQLAARVRAAGIAVEVHVEGEPSPLPRGLDLVAYRVAQEALTNILKHAGPARARVTVIYSTDHLRLEVIDDGVGAAVAPALRGHGLEGMRERVAIYGGHVEAGPGPGGGYLVCATLPLRREASP